MISRALLPIGQDSDMRLVQQVTRTWVTSGKPSGRGFMLSDMVATLSCGSKIQIKPVPSLAQTEEFLIR
tara:strand:- start:44 stop:250 length:207 start_codon:yes stop_codon:yes gene_type:complete